MADEAAVPETPQPLTKAPGKKAVIATVFPVSNFHVGDIHVTSTGTELSAEDSKKVFEEATKNGVKLIEVKKQEGE